MCKTSIEGLGANKTDDAIVRCGKALGTLHSVLEQFDADNATPDVSGAHKKPSYKKELTLILNELQKANVFKVFPGRAHTSFPRPTNILHAKPTKNIVTWIITHLDYIISTNTHLKSKCRLESWTLITFALAFTYITTQIHSLFKNSITFKR